MVLITNLLIPSFWRRPEFKQHPCLERLQKITLAQFKFAWVLPCKARWLLHKPTVTQAHSMLCVIPDLPSAGMTGLL